jgi:hypothetical protein
MRDKHSSKSILAVIIALVISIIGATGLVVATHTPQRATVATSSTAQSAAVKAATKPFTHLSYAGEDGKNALELLKKHDGNVITKQSSLGEYVDSIDGVKGGTNNKYWTFYINGVQSQVGAGAYVSKSGDNIEWKFE